MSNQYTKTIVGLPTRNNYRKKWAFFKKTPEFRAFAEKLWEVCEGFCPICLKPMIHLHYRGWIVGGLGDLPTFDHKIPLSKGGAIKDFSNIQIMCLRCNAKKGDRI